MTGDASITNRCPGETLNQSLARQVASALGEELGRGEPYDLSFTFLDDPQMEALNQSAVGHEGTTDVISLDFCQPPGIAGEIYICIPEARRQAKKWKATWQQEVIRYMIHGVLHLSGYDDLRAADKRRMKSEEDRLLESFSKRFNLNKLGVVKETQTR